LLSFIATMATKGRNLRKRRRFDDSDSEDEEFQITSPIQASPKKRRRRPLQRSDDEDDTETKPKKQRKKRTVKSPQNAINRTPKPLKLTEAKSEKDPFDEVEEQAVSATPSKSTDPTTTKVSSMKKNTPKKASSKKKADAAKSHDIRKYFGTPSTASEFFSKFDTKPNYANLQKQTSVVKNMQNNGNSSSNDQAADKSNGDSNHNHNNQPQPKILDLDDSDDENDHKQQDTDHEEVQDIEMKHSSELNKPLKRRKKTPSPTKPDKTQLTSPGLSRNLQQLTCALPNVNKSSDSQTSNASEAAHGADSDIENKDSNTERANPSQQNTDCYTNGTNGDNHNHHSQPSANQPGTSSKKQAGRKRKLSEISKDDGSQSTSQKTDDDAANPPAKKAKKWYPGFSRQDNPPQHGQTEIPKAKPYCLSNMRFVITGQLPSLTRDECKDLILEYGGRVTGSVSGMTRYLIAGEEAGESKLAKAKEKKVAILDESGFLDLLRTLPAGKAPKVKPVKDAKPPKGNSSLSAVVATRGTNKQQQQQSQPPPPQQQQLQQSVPQPVEESETLLFVDKYKPVRSSDLIGNPSVIKQLRDHLLNWDHIKNQTGKGRNAPKKGVLLSGQPGIGKTSAINVIARELGYNTIEFNASDTRSKKSLQNVISQSLNNRTMTDFFATKKKGTDKPSLVAKGKTKNLIIMDEVDGMSSGDRGGCQELVGYIQTSMIPIICICNDRHNQKLKTLANYCLDLKFRKPTSKQVSSRLFSIARREGYNVDMPTIEKLADGTNGDIRQMLHLLQFWRTVDSSQKLSFGEVKDKLQSANKDVTMGPWDVTPKLFYSGTNVQQGISYYFTDYGLIPLMVQENYLNISKGGGGGGGYGGYYNHNRNTSASSNRNVWSLADLQNVANAAQAIANGDLIDRRIRSLQQYDSLPYHGVLSSLQPAQYSARCGRLSGRIGFPLWMGKNSTRRKNDRLFSELAANINGSHDVPQCGVTGTVLTMDYMPMLKEKVMKPMEQRQDDGIDETVEFMKMYNITREDWDTISTLGAFGADSKQKKGDIVTKTKTAFTRKCKVELAAMSKDHVKKTKKGAMTDLKVRNADDVASEAEDDEEDDEESTGNGDDVSKDSMIKAVKGKGKGSKAATKKKAKAAAKPKKKTAKKKTSSTATKKKRKK